MRAFVSAAAFALASASRAAAGDVAAPGRPAWEIDVGAEYVAIGGEVQTGGFAPHVALRRTFPIGPAWSIWLGARASAFGFSDETAWLGVLAGPHVGARWRPPSLPLSVGASLALDGGRLPACNDWGLCLPFDGFFPGVRAELAYGLGPVLSVAAEGGVRVVRTLAWSGASLDFGAAVRFAF